MTAADLAIAAPFALYFLVIIFPALLAVSLAAPKGGR